MIYKGKEKLNNVHPDLTKVANLAGELTGLLKFNISEGYRDNEIQKKLFKEGKTKTLNSKHCIYPSRAIDIYPVSDDGKKVLWLKEDFNKIIDKFKEASKELNIEITCGIDWGWDSPHIELK